MPTYGPSGQPNSMTVNFDALFSTSLANYKKKLMDNISSASPFFQWLKPKSESQDGGAYIAIDLMYGLAPVDFFQGYDELPLTPTEGITQAQFDWRMMAVPVSISMEEERKNAQRIVNLVEAKLQQVEIAAQEAWPKAFLQGSLYNSSGTDIRTPATSLRTGAYAFDPLPLLVCYAPSGTFPSLTIGGINQNTYSWWQNVSATSSATTTGAFMDELLNLYNTCSKGPMGPPKFGLCDQITWELLHKSYRSYFNNTAMENGQFPFPNLKFFGATVTWDQYVPNVAASSGAGSLDTTSTGKGTFYFLNDQTFAPFHDSQTNFKETEWQKPVNQAARYKHLLHMGNVTINNRRKNGVLGNIARSLT